MLSKCPVDNAELILEVVGGKWYSCCTVCDFMLLVPECDLVRLTGRF